MQFKSLEVSQGAIIASHTHTVHKCNLELQHIYTYTILYYIIRYFIFVLWLLQVDGLPGLILCSGTVVAAGREPFKSVNYTAQKSPAQTHLTTNRMGLRRLKSLNRKLNRILKV